MTTFDGASWDGTVSCYIIQGLRSRARYQTWSVIFSVCWLKAKFSRRRRGSGSTHCPETTVPRRSMVWCSANVLKQGQVVRWFWNVPVLPLNSVWQDHADHAKLATRSDKLHWTAPINRSKSHPSVNATPQEVTVKPWMSLPCLMLVSVSLAGCFEHGDYCQESFRGGCVAGPGSATVASPATVSAPPVSVPPGPAASPAAIPRAPSAASVPTRGPQYIC